VRQPSAPFSDIWILYRTFNAPAPAHRHAIAVLRRRHRLPNILYHRPDRISTSYHTRSSGVSPGAEGDSTPRDGRGGRAWQPEPPGQNKAGRVLVCRLHSKRCGPASIRIVTFPHPLHHRHGMCGRTSLWSRRHASIAVRACDLSPAGRNRAGIIFREPVRAPTAATRRRSAHCGRLRGGGAEHPSRACPRSRGMPWPG